MKADYLARFWYPCQTAEKDSRSRAVIWSLLISGLGMWYCNQLMTSTNDEVSFWHVLTMSTFWEWLQNNSRFLRIMLTKAWLQRLLHSDKTLEISLKVTQNRIEDWAALLCSHLCSVYCYLCIWNCSFFFSGCQRLEMIVRGEPCTVHFISSRLNLDNGPLEAGVGALRNQIVLERKE